MTSRLLAIAAVVLGSVACAASSEEQSDRGSQDVVVATDATAVVRAYYASTQSEDPSRALDGIVADGAIIAAPSVQLLKHVPEISGKTEFVKAVAGGSFLLENAVVRDVIARDEHLVVSRIDLPLPNGDVLTQVEFFTLEGGKITRLDSYYDATRFIAALPAIALAKLKAALGVD